jgi:hypothetical protein
MRYGNARHPAQDPARPPVHGPQIGGGAVTVTHVVNGPDPIAGAYMGRLFATTTLISPSASGRFRGGDKGSMDNRQHQDIGPLQRFSGRSLVGLGLGNGQRLGAQGGPGSQPAYPGTGSNVAPSVRSALAGMDLPQVLRT